MGHERNIKQQYLVGLLVFRFAHSLNENQVGVYFRQQGTLLDYIVPLQGSSIFLEVFSFVHIE